MKLINKQLEKDIENKILLLTANKVENGILDVLEALYKAILDNKRISYGTVHTIKVLSKYIFDNLKFTNTEKLNFAKEVFKTAKNRQ